MLQAEASVKGKMAKCAGNVNYLGQSNLGMQAEPSRTQQSHMNQHEYTEQNQFTNAKYCLLAVLAMILTIDICC